MQNMNCVTKMQVIIPFHTLLNLDNLLEAKYKTMSTINVRPGTCMTSKSEISSCFLKRGTKELKFPEGPRMPFVDLKKSGVL